MTRGDDGIEILRESVAVLAGAPARDEHAQALVALGGALRRTGRRADSREPLAERLELAFRCGAERLVSEERSNAEIAQTLYLSVKTVEHHLSNAYGKLQIKGPGARRRLTEKLPAADAGA